MENNKNTKLSIQQEEAQRIERKVEFKRAKSFMELEHVINATGGCFDSYRLLNMSVFDFIQNVAGQNDIHFMFIPPTSEEDDED
jgi:hypothetical protein